MSQAEWAAFVKQTDQAVYLMENFHCADILRAYALSSHSFCGEDRSDVLSKVNDARAD
jgi:hypothetical protein